MQLWEVYFRFGLFENVSLGHHGTRLVKFFSSFSWSTGNWRRCQWSDWDFCKETAKENEITRHSEHWPELVCYSLFVCSSFPAFFSFFIVLVFSLKKLFWMHLCSWSLFLLSVVVLLQIVTFSTIWQISVLPMCFLCGFVSVLRLFSKIPILRKISSAVCS